MWKKFLLQIIRIIVPMILDEVDKDPKIPLIKAP